VFVGAEGSAHAGTSDGQHSSGMFQSASSFVHGRTVPTGWRLAEPLLLTDRDTLVVAVTFPAPGNTAPLTFTAGTGRTTHTPAGAVNLLDLYGTWKYVMIVSVLEPPGGCRQRCGVVSPRTQPSSCRGGTPRPAGSGTLVGGALLGYVDTFTQSLWP
jgi:hypothetical protein